MVSRLVAPSFSLANSLISADVLSAARERYKNKNWKHFCAKINYKNPKTTIKNQGDLNLGMVDNVPEAHIFLFGLI